MVKENPDFDYYPTSILSEKEFEEKIEKEKKTSLLSTFFITHGYIEALLMDWLYYCGEGKQNVISEEVQSNFERIGFFYFIHLHFIMGNIDNDLFHKLRKFNTARNDFAHAIRDINLESDKTKKGIEQNINQGIEMYRKLFNIYQATLDRIGKKFILGKSNLGE